MISRISVFCIFLICWTTKAVEVNEDGFSLRTMFLFDHNQPALFRHEVENTASKSSDEVDQATRVKGLLKLKESQSRDEEGFYSNGPVPDWTDRATVTIFAKLANNAYYPRNSASWIPVPGIGEAEYAEPFGWDFDNHLRGYVFANMQNQVVISIKGTDLPWTETGSNDKAQDWLMFSCCGEGNIWQTGCGCDAPIPGSNNRTCSLDCIQECIEDRGHQYFNAALDIYNTVKAEYPNGEIYITGHSLGGALAALLGSVVSYPAVAFESPPDRGYSWLMGNQWSNEDMLYLPIFHFGNNRDPIFDGGNRCTICSSAGAPIRTECHLGYKCEWNLSFPPTEFQYDAYLYHKIAYVLQLLKNSYVPLPECEADVYCNDCSGWVWQG